MQPISQREIKLIRSLSHKKYREQTGLFVAESEKCVRELLPLGCELLVIEESREGISEMSLSASNAQILRVASASQFKQMSSLQTPQGVLGVFRKPVGGLGNIGNLSNQPSSLTLVLDGIQDPGNLGTIIRTACWFGVSEIVCSHGTVDAYSPKVVQATMGALAKVNIVYTSLPEYLQGLPKGATIVGTLLNGKPLPEVLPALKERIAANSSQRTQRSGGRFNLRDKDVAPPCFYLVMGNEGNGISEAVRDCLTDAVLIPSVPADRPQIESLNVSVATAILLSQLLL